jgi:hypothetical protein
LWRIAVVLIRPLEARRDFVDAWYPERGFGIPGRGPYSACNIARERELPTIGFLDLSDRQPSTRGLSAWPSRRPSGTPASTK